jgi:hypothetical protein
MAKMRANASDERDNFASFEKVPPTPALRIEIWLQQIELRAQSVTAALNKEMPEREQAAHDAQANYRRLLEVAERTGKARDRRAAEKAARIYCDAANAVRPALWWLAQDATINTALVRESLTKAAAGEAVEAALRAMNATWKLQGKKIEKQLRAASKGYKSWSSGGTKRAAAVRAKLAGRNLDIVKRRDALAELKDRSDAEIHNVLAETFHLSVKQIRRILTVADTR